MRGRHTRRVALAAAGVLVVSALAAANGATRTSASVVDQADALPGDARPAQSAGALVPRSPGYERSRRLYERMNRRAEQLRLEVNKGEPDPDVVAELEAKLRSLANQL